jgi:hypothetical protein
VVVGTKEISPLILGMNGEPRLIEMPAYKSMAFYSVPGILHATHESRRIRLKA